MRLSDKGCEVLRQLEGVRYKLYDDKTGKTIDKAEQASGYPTIGVGHLVRKGDTQFDGLTLSDNEVDELLRGDVQTVEDVVTDAVRVRLSQNQFDALVSFVFNIGVTAFLKSTLLRVLNTGNYAGAADQFLVWNKSKGVVVEGLNRRRRTERALFLS